MMLGNGQEKKIMAFRIVYCEANISIVGDCIKKIAIRE